MLILFIVVLVVVAVVFAVTKMRKQAENEQNWKEEENIVPIKTLGKKFPQLAIAKWDILNFPALVVNGGKMEYEYRKDYKSDEDCWEYNFKRKKIYHDYFMASNNLITFIYVKKEASYIDYEKRAEEEIVIKVGNKNYKPESDDDKAWIYSDMFKVFKTLKDGKELEDKLAKQKAEMDKTIADKQYIVDLLSNKLEADRKAYAEKLAKESEGK